MARALLALLVLLAVGCSGGAADREAATAPEDHAPPWLNQTFTDGTITIRYPEGWIRNTTKRFGRVLSDNKSITAAFVGVQYLPRREWDDHRQFADLAARILRPPDGKGTTLFYTQAARIGGRHGVEASIIWATSGRIPLGPTMRVFGIPLDSGEVAIIIFGAESPSRHAHPFAWIKKKIAWN